MSWYRFGGFSAYFSVPSGRRWNHSGCSFSHGWSGEHWIAKSSAISIPSFFASATRARSSFSVPSDGSIASCPPSLAPIAQGLPTSPGSAVSELFRPLRFVRPMGWIGIDPGLDPEAPGSRSVDLERAVPDVVAERLERHLGPAGGARTLVANRRAERLVAVAKDPGGDLDRVANRSLDRVAAAVDLRRHLLDLDPRWGRLRDRHPRSLTDEEGSKRGAPSLGRRPPASDLAPVREAGPRCIPFRRLARGGRPVVVAGPAARATRRVRLAIQVAVGLRGVPAAPGPAGGAGHSRRGGRGRGEPSLLGGRLGRGCLGGRAR